MEQPILLTSRLVLRPYEAGDWAAVHRFGADAETAQYQAWGPNTEDDTRQFVARCVDAAQAPEEKGYFFAIILRETGWLIGGCNLSATGIAPHEAMIGYTLDKACWRHGYTTEAAGELLRFGFRTRNLHRIVSRCDAENTGSWRVMEKIGMRREAHEIQSVWFKDRWHDWLRYAILAHEWVELADPDVRLQDRQIR